MITMKKGFIAAAAIAALGTGSVGITSAFAAEHVNPRVAQMQNLVQALADKFGVSVDEVQAVFDAQHAETEATRAEHEADRLAQAVTDGIITQEQADAIREHREEMKAFMESLDGMTPEERQDALDAQREANKAWAEENDLPRDIMHTGAPEHGHGRPRNGHRPE